MLAILLLGVSFVVKRRAIVATLGFLGGKDENLSLDYIQYFAPMFSFEYRYYALFCIGTSGLLFVVYQIFLLKQKAFTRRKFLWATMWFLVILAICFVILWLSKMWLAELWE